MRYLKLKLCLPVVLGLIAAQHAWADSVRCGDNIVTVGESIASVQAVCGSPADVQRSTLVSATTTGTGDGTRNTAGAAVPVETWTYNRGPDEFMVSIRFVDGKVVSTQTLQARGH